MDNCQYWTTWSSLKVDQCLRKKDHSLFDIYCEIVYAKEMDNRCLPSRTYINFELQNDH